ncbi:glycosyltransferase [Rubripirellula obstinata]|uniref:glycosyltransferase n=1 Tax=Rubripirellula obstinata TaxID=406547 RepID=UPI0008325F0A|nr:hypothetical protein [Rubripirellula obstinata]
MNIVILHCHFQRGGVTQVVENHVRFLRQCDDVDRVVLVSGPRSDGLTDKVLSSTIQLNLPDFDYDTKRFSADQNRERADQIAQDLIRLFASEGLHPDQTVLHWHNHSLGKNTAAPLVIDQLAKQGWSFLLQVHDFAEDNRPENLARLIQASGASSKSELDRFLYPTTGKIRYAALTAGDTETLSSLGCKAMTLSNSVTLPSEKAPDQETTLAKVRSAFSLPSDARWTLYPVRGIRRKNVGEWLLLAQLLPDDWYSGLTLQPTTAVEKNSYLRWKELAATVAPKAVFDAGHHEQISFAENLSASSNVFSTSVAEGFGMTFLEPWLAGRSVVARRLPGVTSDFEKAGVNLSSFYDAIPIPGNKDWIDQCHREIQSAMDSAIAQLPAGFRPARKLASPITDSIDFALLTPKRQTEVLCRMADDVGFADAVRQRSQKLVDAIASPPDHETIHANAGVIADYYSIESVGKRLMKVYESVLKSDAVMIDTMSNLSAVDLVNLNRPFYPCRTETLSDES